ncbi:MAG: thiamine ABC transporter substrate-binding protein [Candidatus Asgardarchaeia archaeon]
MALNKKAISLALILFIAMGFWYPAVGGVSESNASYQSFVAINQDANATELVIYTYESLLKWGNNYTEVYNNVFKAFEEKYNVTIRLVEFSDARSALLRLVEEKDNPKADVIIGLDNILAIEAIKSDVLEPYTPTNLSLIKPDLVQALDPTHHVVPYDYGLIALVYDTKYVNKTTYPEITHLTFDDLLDPKYSDLLVTEDPTQSSTGLAFLLWQIAVYSKLLNKDWKEWWQQAKDHIKVTKSWGDAYDIFLEESSGRHIVVSYGTDGAYSYYFYNSTRYNATVIYVNDNPYAWLQIEGLGLVKNAPHSEMAKTFIEWFLSNEVQQYIPLNNWMYPANQNVTLPEAYKYAIDPNTANIANNLLNQTEIEENLNDWLYDWTEIMVTTTSGESPQLDNTIYLIAGTIVGLAFVALIIVYLRRKHII